MVIKEFAKFFKQCLKDLETVNYLYKQIRKSVDIYAKIKISQEA